MRLINYLQLSHTTLLSRVVCLATICFNCTTHAEAQTTTIESFLQHYDKKVEGYFTTYIKGGKCYLELPDSVLQRDILCSITIVRGSARKETDRLQRFGFAGDPMYNTMIRFEKNKNENSINLIETNTNEVYQLPMDLPSQVYTKFPIEVQFEHSSLIDISKLVYSDNELFSLSGSAETLNLGSYDPQLMHLDSIIPKKDAIIFRSTRSYRSNTQGGSTNIFADQSTIWQVGSSWILLPKVPMQKRYTNPHVGYFETEKIVFDSDLNRDVTAIINRWRLIPSNIAAYQKGELVEPIKPITIYVDKNFPKEFQPYIIEGINNWQKAFEYAGFKNAIQGVIEPDDNANTDFAIDNANCSFLSYKPSVTPNAYGPILTDPRSGEIISTRLGVYHNIFDLLQRWYFVMCGTTDSNAHQLPLNITTMGPLIRTVITHEIGHTLGLRHNFAASFDWPVDSLRSHNFIQKNGLGASIMDYTRFNYVSQPQDKLLQEDLLPRIGSYDNFAIEYGYRYFSDSVKNKDTILQNWVYRQIKNPQLQYNIETDLNDPKVQSEDMSNDQIWANNLGIKNLKLVMSNIQDWTRSTNDDYQTLRHIYTTIVARYMIYMGHAIKYIGGAYNVNERYVSGYPITSSVEKEKQRNALRFLTTNFLTEPNWLYVDDIEKKANFRLENEVQEDLAKKLGQLILRSNELKKRELEPNAYSAEAFLDDLWDGIFHPIEGNAELSSYTKMLQQIYVNRVLSYAMNKGYLADNMAFLMTKQLMKTKQWADESTVKASNTLTKYHLEAISTLISKWTNNK